MRILGRHTDRDESSPICADGGALCTSSMMDIVQHTGYVFTAVNQSDVGSGNSSSLFFTVAGSATPGHVHFGYEVMCEGEAEVAFYENPTMTANTGTPFGAPICLNRAIGQASAWGSTSIYKDATLNLTPATLLDIEVIGNAKQVGGKAVSMLHWTLCRGKTYCIKVTNQSGAANETTIRIVWGRHVEIE